MGRPFVSCPWAIKGGLFLFLPFSWNIFCNICSMPSMVTALELVDVEILLGQVYHWLVPLHIETGKRFSFGWLILTFCCVQFHQPCSCWNLMFRMLDDYLYDPILVGSWIRQSFCMFYLYLFFSARFWVFYWKFRVRVRCRIRGKEVDCHWLFFFLLLKIFPSLICWKRSAIGVGLFQEAVMRSKLDVR